MALAVLAGCNRDESQLAEPGRISETASFSRDVAPIVFEHCSQCHCDGEAAPFSLLTYEDVRDRASQIVEVTQSRFMPPWLPKNDHGEFQGARARSYLEQAHANDPDHPVPHLFLG